MAGALPAFADVITLRNGQELRGRVRAKGDQMRIELELGGTVVVDKGDIKNVVVEGPTSAMAEASAISPELMKRLEERENLHTLLERLADEKASVRQDAEKQLAQAGRGALPIVRPALSEGPAEWRAALLRILAAIGDPEALPQIAAILQNPKDAALHVGAAAALAEIGGCRSVGTLTELLANSKDEAVRAACLEKLADMQPPFAAPFIAEATKTDALRAAAYSAIGKWEDPVILPYVGLLLDGPAHERAAAWVADLITPAHAAAFTKLFEGAKDKKTLHAGVVRLHKDFPTVGDVELLAAPQLDIQNAALDALQKIVKDRKSRVPGDWRAERDKATKARLLLVPLGTTGPALIKELADEVALSLKVPVEVDAVKSVPLAAAEGRPADARRALARLDLRGASDFHSVRVIGVASVDVTVPGCDYALAPTRYEGAMVLSLARLGGSRDKMIFGARRLLLHGLAKSLGMPACGDALCPTAPIYDAREIDAKSSRYCAACQRAFTAIWDAECEATGFRYKAAGQKLAALATQAKSKEMAAAAAYQYERALLSGLAMTQWKEYQDLETDAKLNAVVTKRVDLLDRVEKWLMTKGLTQQPPPPPGPPRKRQPAGG